MTSSQKAWDNYWQTGQNAACIQQSPAGYEDTVTEYWSGVFAQQPATSKVLDICTGNGAIAALAQRYARQHALDFDVHGIDAANIAPHSIDDPDLNAVTFHAGQALENTPFEDGQFNLIIGQYGLEYTNTEKTLPELVRLLAADGRLQLVLHAKQGVTISAAHESLKFTRMLFGQNKFIQHASAFIRSLCEVRNNRLADQKNHQRCQKQMNKAAKQLQRYADHPENGPMVRNLLSVTEHMLKNHRHFTEAQMLGKLEELSEHIELHQQRLLAATSAALSEQQMQALSAQLQQLGLEVSPFSALIRQRDGKSLGWSLGAHKPKA